MKISRMLRGIMMAAMISLSALTLSGCTADDPTRIGGPIFGPVAKVWETVIRIVDAGIVITIRIATQGTTVKTDDTRTKTQVLWTCPICGKTQLGDPGKPPFCCGKQMVAQVGAAGVETASQPEPVLLVCPRFGQVLSGDPQNPPTCCGVEIVPQAASGEEPARVAFAADDEE